MLKLSKQVIYNKIEQSLISIPSDFCRQEACEINNAVQMVGYIKCRTFGPMKMWENRSLKPGNQ